MYTGAAGDRRARRSIRLYYGWDVASGCDLPKQPGKPYPRAEHPVIRTHPVSGRPALFVNRGFTTRIVQLAKHERAAVLEVPYRHVETPEFQCRLTWRPGSVAFWDNRCVQHHGMWDYYPNRRRGLRVTIKGDKPFNCP